MITLFQASVPPSIHALQSLAAVLAKGAASAEARKIDPSVLLGSRLAPDMLPLTRQVQIATDMVKNGCARLAGLPPPSTPDTETTFEALQDRIATTIAYLETLPAEAIDGSESRVITMKIGGREVTFPGQTYLLSFVWPNLYFHTSAAYAILRHNGVVLGKRDFLGAIPELA